MAELTKGRVHTADEVNGFIGGKHQGGIRYSGTFPDIRRIGAFMGGGADAIYPDKPQHGVIRYVGEGQIGDQRMTVGNRVLVHAHFTDATIHVFQHLGPARYRYEGTHRVAGVETAITPDRNGDDRASFVFELRARS